MSPSKAALSINLNKIALIRNSRKTAIPDVLTHARYCIDSGADGITVHPRPDQRHIRADDCRVLSGAINVELNIEGNPFAGPRLSELDWVSDYPGFMPLVAETRPQQCTLVPDGDNQLTSDHGFDMRQSGDELKPIIAELHKLGCRVSLFMDPDKEQIAAAKEAGADRIELYTGPYAEAWEQGDYQSSLRNFAEAAAYADSIGLGVNAGHDLNLDNLQAFAQALPALAEVSIGHAFTVDALSYGIADTIARYQACLKS